MLKPKPPRATAKPPKRARSLAKKALSSSSDVADDPEDAMLIPAMCE